MFNNLTQHFRRMLNLDQSTWDRDAWWLNYRLGRPLGLSESMIQTLLAGGPLPPRFRYRHFKVKKRDGSARQIVEPGPDLKEVQRILLKKFLNRQSTHPAAMGFRKGLSIADHAWMHAGAAIIITADIEDFFPSTRRERIKEWWSNRGYSEVETRLLTTLTTYHGSLPQGAPTSPALSNLVNHRLDERLDERARHSGGRYSRYGDDMVFSWPDGYGPPSDFEPAVKGAIRAVGYELHPVKGWNIWERRDEPEVTGLILTRLGEVDLPRSMKRLMKALARSSDPYDRARLSGYRGYESMVKRT